MSKADFEAWWLDNEQRVTHILLALRAAYGNVIEIDDLRSETFLRCWASSPRQSDDGYSGWVWGVAKRVVADALRDIYRIRRLSETLGQQMVIDQCAGLILERLIVRCRIDILMDLCAGWRDSDDSWDVRLTKRRVVQELVQRIDSGRPVSRKVLAEAMNLSPQYIGRLLNDIANEIVEIEDAEV